MNFAIDRVIRQNISDKILPVDSVSSVYCEVASDLSFATVLKEFSVHDLARSLCAFSGELCAHLGVESAEYFLKSQLLRVMRHQGRLLDLEAEEAMLVFDVLI